MALEWANFIDGRHSYKEVTKSWFLLKSTFQFSNLFTPCFSDLNEFILMFTSTVMELFPVYFGKWEENWLQCIDLEMH